MCGSNDDLYEKLWKRVGDDPRIHIAGKVGNVPQLMQGADLFLTKPGGLSTSEAMAAGLPMVLIDAVAGCEEYNLAFFLHNAMAVTADLPESIADTALALLNDQPHLSALRAAMAPPMNAASAETIYQWLHDHGK